MGYDAVVSTDRRATWRAPGTKVAHHTMREVNRSLVLDILREGEPVSRVELSRRTRLSKPTVSSIVEDLMADGLVRDAGMAAPSHTTGRPASLLVYDERALGFAAIQLGGAVARAAVADGLGKIVGRGEAATSSDVEAMLLGARRALRDAAPAARLRADRIGACGVVIDGDDLDWRDPALRSRLERTLRTPVVVAASSHAAALAELRAAEGAPRCLAWVHVDERIDCAVVVEGQLLTGAHGRAGALAHLPVVADGPRCRCGARGCLETVAAGEAARRAPATAGEKLGRGIAHLAALLDPDVVAVAGPLAGDDYLQAARASARTGTRVEIRRSAVDGDGPLLGGIHLAAGVATPSYRLVGRAEARGAAAV